MAITGNKGEWSEIYTLFKLLGDGVIHAGDGNLEQIADLFYPIISILRQEKNGEYRYSPKKDIVLISSDKEELRIPLSHFQDKAEELFQAIKQTKTTTFAIPAVEDFMSSVQCEKLKAGSKDKSDIHIIIHDLRTGMMPKLGFSIKSQLGGASTLFNASKTTNVLYTLTDNPLSEEDIEHINSIKPAKGLIRERIEAIRQLGADICFQSMVSSTFQNNLILIDSMMPRILDEMLRIYYLEGISSLREIVALLEERNPLNYDLASGHHFYEYKVKRFLTDIALGMTAGTTWNGHYDATGGYLVVKDDGDILCYHIYNKNDFEDYLLNNVKFDTPSTSRHGFAVVEDKALFKLNFQLRFIR